MKEIWEYETCDILTPAGMKDANQLLEEGWEPFAATESERVARLWLKRRILLEENEEEIKRFSRRKK